MFKGEAGRGAVCERRRMPYTPVDSFFGVAPTKEDHTIFSKSVRRNVIIVWYYDFPYNRASLAQGSKE